MTSVRHVGIETLDHLGVDDPAARRSRRDLRRIHRVMGTQGIVRRALSRMASTPRGTIPLRVLELGAGDGHLMLGVARTLAPAWQPVALTLLDRQALVEQATIVRYAQVGWTAVAHTADVLDWAKRSAPPPCPGGTQARWDLVVANLFLHHFHAPALAAVLAAVADRTDRFFACEPRRHWLALAGSHLSFLLGANAVTRTDAVLSVQAGFTARELSSAWPASDDWRTQEYHAGLFSHCFRAERVKAA